MVFFFIKRMYPYIINIYHNFKLTLIVKKLFKLLIKYNFKKLYYSFLKLYFISNLNNFLTIKVKKNLILLNYKKTNKLNLIINSNIKTKIINYLNFHKKHIKNWFFSHYNFNEKFNKKYLYYNSLKCFYINLIFKKFYLYKTYNIYLNYFLFFLYNKFQRFNKIKSFEIYYDLIKYKDNFKFYIMLNPKNLIKTISRRYKKGFVFLKY